MPAMPGKHIGIARDHLLATALLLWAATALLLSLGVIGGIVLGAGGFSPPPRASLATVCVCLLAAVLGRGRRAIWLPCALIAALALGLWREETTRAPAGAAGLAFYAGRDVALVGTVTGEPEALDRGQTLRVAVVTLAIGNGAARPVAGIVHVGTLVPLSYGDRVALTGALSPPPDLAGAGAGYRAYLASQGIETVMDYPRLRRLGTGNGNPLLALAGALRALLERGIRRVLPAQEGALLLGILVGTRTRALGDLTAPFVATGMIHVVAVDGLKVSIFVGAVYRVARRALGARLAPLPALAALLLYVTLTGATPAGLRAAAMWVLALAALRFGRRSDGATSLALAAALLALATPRILWDLGFQLSLGGTAAIVLLAPGIERRLARLPPLAREGAAVSLAAQAGTLPLVAAGFGQVSPVAPLANALLLPLLAPIIVLGAPAALAGALLPALGAAPGLLVYPPLALMTAAVGLLARLPLAAFPSPAWPLPAGCAYYLLLGLAAGGPLRAAGPAPHRTIVEGVRTVGLRPLPALGAAGALLLATVAWQAPPPRLYTLQALPLGGGQGMLLTTPGGRTVLLDGGATPSQLDAALGARLPFWRTRLDLVALSDADHAHTGGLRDLPGRYSIGQALDPGAVYPAADYARWRAALRAGGVPEAKLRAGDRYALGRDPDAGPSPSPPAPAYLDVLQPGGLNPDAPDTPVALRLVVGRLSLLLLNRAALAAEPAALQADGRKRDTVLALPAGADDPREYATLIGVVRPRLVVLPAPDDARDDPAADLVAARAARAIGAQVWQSSGTTSLNITTDGIRYELAIGP